MYNRHTLYLLIASLPASENEDRINPNKCRPACTLVTIILEVMPFSSSWIMIQKHWNILNIFDNKELV